MITDTTELSLGILVAEFEGGGYAPIGNASNVREAKELATDDFRQRVKDNEKGRDVPCPIAYKVWDRDFNGDRVVVSEMVHIDGLGCCEI